MSERENAGNRGLRLRSVLAIACLSLLAGAGLFYGWSALQSQHKRPPVHGRAELLLSRYERSLLGKRDNSPIEDYLTFQRTQETLLRSPKVLNIVATTPVIAKLPIIQQHREDPVGWIGQHLNTSFDGEVMSVWLDAGTPQERATITNNIVTAYLDHVVHSVFSRRKSEAITLAGMVKEAQDRLRKKHEERAALIRDEFPHYVAIESEGDGDILSERAADCEGRLLTLRMAMAGADARLAALGDADPRDPSRTERKNVEIDRADLVAQENVVKEELARLNAILAAPRSVSLMQLDDETKVMTEQLRALQARLFELEFEMESPTRVGQISQASE